MEEIRKIVRPKNTIVYRIRDGFYGVRERNGVKYFKSGNPGPINEKVIGHIENGRFAVLAKEMTGKPLFLSYGSFALVKDCSDGICDDLLEKVGMDSEKRERFYVERMKRIPENHHVAIDGPLWQDYSSVNSLSGFFYKSRGERNEGRIRHLCL